MITSFQPVKNTYPLTVAHLAKYVKEEGGYSLSSIHQDPNHWMYAPLDSYSERPIYELMLEVDHTVMLMRDNGVDTPYTFYRKDPAVVTVMSKNRIKYELKEEKTYEET